MKKFGIFLWGVILPMLISMGIDCRVGLPDKWNIVLYAILSGIGSFFWKNRQIKKRSGDRNYEEK